MRCTNSTRNIYVIHLKGVEIMDFPTIHTNFWDAVIAVPVVMVLTSPFYFSR
jgi:hypothetical protein